MNPLRSGPSNACTERGQPMNDRVEGACHPKLVVSPPASASGEWRTVREPPPPSPRCKRGETLLPPTARIWLVDPGGIAPSFPQCECSVLLLDDGPGLVEPPGVAPGLRGCRPRVILFHHGPEMVVACRP